MNKLEQEARNWMKEKYMYGISAKAYQVAACETAIFPKEKATEYLTLGLSGEPRRLRLAMRLVMCCGTVLY
jgi:hypothetical protein